MYLIVGLGNPEEEYANTRHNMGFQTINKLAKELEIDITRNKFDGIYGSGIINNEKIILLKPQTYMNLSGKSIKQFMGFYKISQNDLIVVYDDIDLDSGTIRIRKKGSPGTHNGMKSVVHEIGQDDFIRIRVGIGTPDYKEDLINYVIGQIPEEEKNILEEATDKAAKAVMEIINQNVESAMNKYNISEGM